MQTSTPPLPQYATIAEVLTALRISRPTLWRLVRAGEFPPPVAISTNRKVFPVEAVLRHLDRKTEEVNRTRKRMGADAGARTAKP